MIKSRQIWQVVIAIAMLGAIVAIVCGDVRDNCPWGVPTGQAVQVLDNGYYVVGYSKELRIPLWASYTLTPEDIVESKRSGTFHEDERISADARSTLQDYAEPIYDRGHLAPSATFGRSTMAMQSTYLLTNVVPQLPGFNRGAWSVLERVIRRIAMNSRRTYVVTGCIFDADNDGRIDNPIVPKRLSDRVAIPTHFFKVVLFWRDGTAHMVGFLLTHNASVSVDHAIVSVDTIESASGLDVFSRLPNRLEDELESKQ